MSVETKEVKIEEVKVLLVDAPIDEKEEEGDDEGDDEDDQDAGTNATKTVKMPSDYHDWKIRCGDTIFECHRAFIVKDSPYFQALITSAKADGSNMCSIPSSINGVAKGAATEKAFEGYLRLVYDHTLESSTVRDIASLAMYFGNALVSGLCDRYLLTILRPWIAANNLRRSSDQPECMPMVILFPLGRAS
jgi:hypothetical protein